VSRFSGGPERLKCDIAAGDGGGREARRRGGYGFGSWGGVNGQIGPCPPRKIDFAE
jgi:hypothetical protein